jgi:hypothetical protein
MMMVVVGKTARLRTRLRTGPWVRVLTESESPVLLNFDGVVHNLQSSQGFD